ncbi:MAG: 50S ribosomal protein L19 [Actinobacteria bacterium]|nr:50S ribosomal protein L19 [Actinomycetota bacterium]
MNKLSSIENKYLRTDIPDFKAGDRVRVNIKISEENKERIQAFEGIVIRRSGQGIGETFTVRKISFNVGVERTFPVHSPVIHSIEKLDSGDVRRAKLYYLRDLVGKKAKVKFKRE